MATPLPMQTISQIADKASDLINDQLTKIANQLDVQVQQLKDLKNTQNIKQQLITEFAKIATYSGTPATLNIQNITGLGGKQATEAQFGSLFAKYYKLSLFIQQLKANPVQIVPKLPVDKSSKQTYVNLIEETDQLLQDIARVKEYPEIQYMTAFLPILAQVEEGCQKNKSVLYEQMNQIYTPSGKVTYPDLSESFREREISYQIEPSGMQGSGKETRFIFQDFLKSRGVDEDSDQ